MRKRLGEPHARVDRPITVSPVYPVVFLAAAHGSRARSARVVRLDSGAKLRVARTFCVVITPRIAFEVDSISAWEHRDPADRLIVATARVYGAHLLTDDERIRESGLVGVI